MAENGNIRKVYVVEDNSSTYVVGQTSANTTLNDDLIEVSDKADDWVRYISGKKSWSGTLGLNLDNSANAKQIQFVKALMNGQKVKIFVGILKENKQSDGVVGDAWVASIEEGSDNHAVVSRSVNFTGDGKPTYIYPEEE